MAYRDYYRILDIPQTATDQEIKVAYRKLARKLHPDLNPGDKKAEELFKEVNEANEILSDPDKRRQYDLYGRWQQQAEQRPSPSPSQNPSPNVGFGNAQGVDFSDFGNFEEFIDSLLGGMRGAARGGRNAPGENVEMTAELTLEEAFKGVRKRYRTNAGKVIEVNFPPGVHSGSKVRVKGEGRESAKGGPSGDLLLTVKLSPHPYYTLEGEDLTLELPLSPAEAVLGAQIEVPTLAGKVRLTIPKGTSSGKVLRLAGKGLKKEDNSWGDQLVKIRIDVPAQPSPQERELYEKLAQFTATNIRSHLT